MKRPKGPELKMPDVKVPAVLADLYYDLRDRRLLPLLALVLVAIVATPFLLSQKTETVAPAAAPAAIQALKEAGGHRTASLTVVEANPGLRDYRKRLRGSKPLDPFRSFGKPSLKGAQLGDGSGKGEGSSGSSSPTTSTSTTVKKTKTKNSSTTKTTTTTTTTDGSADGSKGDGGSAAGGGGSGNPAATYTIDVQISIAGEAGVTVEPIERRNVQPLVSLPSEDTPVVTYLGAASGGAKALFNVSKEVTGVYGEAKCVSGTDTCELVELEPEFPVTFVYGPNQDRYRIKLLKISRADG